MSTYTQRLEFAYLTNITKHGTTYAACGGAAKEVYIAERASGGGVTYLGVSETLLAEPLAIVSDGTPTEYYVLTELGVTVLSAVAAPAITAEYTFDTGAHPWLCYTASDRILAPLANGGIRLLSTAGVVLAELCSIVSESTYAVLDGAVLYLFDGQRGRLAFITVGASSLTYEGQIAAPNCREILRAVIDGDNLYCLNRHRVVRFDVTTALEPEFAEDYGLKSVAYTDIAILGSDQIWLGFAESTVGLTGSEFVGSVYGCWNATDGEINYAAPRAALWAVSDVVPYWTSATIGDDPAYILPAAPVITSGLTSSASGGVAWTYTITTSGHGPVQFSSSNLPSWATLNAASGLISGTPPTEAVVNISITATNPGGSDTETLVLTVVNPFSQIVLSSVLASLAVDNLLYVVGSFSSVTDASGVLTRGRGACLNLDTGLFTSWNPDANASIYSLAAHSTHIYLGGEFTTLGGVAQLRAGRVSASTGAHDADFAVGVTGTSAKVRAILPVDADKVYLGFTGSSILVNGDARIGAAAVDFSGTTDAWVVTNGTHTIDSGSSSVRSLLLSGSDILLCGGLLLRTLGAPLEYIAYGRARVDPSTGIAATGVEGNMCYQGLLAGGNLWTLSDDAEWYPLPVPGAGATQAFFSRCSPTDFTRLESYAVTGSVVRGLGADTVSGTVWAFGDFSVIDGVSRAHIATFNGTTGDILAAPAVDISDLSVTGTDMSLQVTDTLVAIVGAFTATVNGEARTNLIIFNKTTGVLS